MKAAFKLQKLLPEMVEVVKADKAMGEVRTILKPNPKKQDKEILMPAQEPGYLKANKYDCF